MTKPHGCNNTRPDASGYWTQSKNPEWVPHRMTRDCQWSRLIKNDGAAGCAGCREKQEATL